MQYPDRKKSICLIVTHKCNLHCKYCFVLDRRDVSMPLEIAKNAILEAIKTDNDKFDFLEIMFMGGEPLCEFPLIKALSEWLPSVSNGKRYVLFAVTNGTLVSDDIKAWLSKNKDCVCLGLSYDGDIIAQDLNRNESKEKIDLPFFIKTWPDQPLKMTISEETVSHLSDNVVALHNMGATVTANCACGCKDWSASTWARYGKELSKLVRFYIENPNVKPINLIADYNLLDVFNDNQEPRVCEAGRSFYAIDVDGKEYPCHLFSPLAQLPENTVDKIRIASILQEEDNPCLSCILNGKCSHCIGMNYRLYGHFLWREKNVCMANQFQFRACCKYHAERISRKSHFDEDDARIAATILKLSNSNFSLRKDDYNE